MHVACITLRSCSWGVVEHHTLPLLADPSSDACCTVQSLSKLGTLEWDPWCFVHAPQQNKQLVSQSVGGCSQLARPYPTISAPGFVLAAKVGK